MATKKSGSLQKSESRAFDHGLKKVAGVSFYEVECAVNEALKEKYPPEEPTDGCYPIGVYTTDMFDDHAVFSMAGKLWSVTYTFADGTATLTGEPEQVSRTYTPVGGAAPPAAEAPPVAPPTGKAFVEAQAKRIDSTLAALSKKMTLPKGA